MTDLISPLGQNVALVQGWQDARCSILYLASCILYIIAGMTVSPGKDLFLKGSGFSLCVDPGNEN